MYPHELSVLCLGPLTNIAIAAALDSGFIANVKRFYIMGGSVSGVGNIRPGVEFNSLMDPESYFIVLNYIKAKPSLLYPWETVVNAGIPKVSLESFCCYSTNISISKNWRTKLGCINSKTIKFLNKAEAKSLVTESNIWTSADLQAVAVMIWPYLSTKSLITNVTPVFDGAARGVLLVDYVQNSGKPKNVEIVQQLDVKGFQKKLIHHFS